MSGAERVHLMDLRERTSAAGNRYLSGWLGKASVVAFLDRDAEEPTWQVFVSTPAPRNGNGSGNQSNRTADRSPFTPNNARRPSRRRPADLGPGELDDGLDDL